MPKRGENIHKRKDGRWEARYRTGVDPSGKIIYGSVYAQTYKEVKEKQREKLNDITRCRHSVNGKNPLFAEVADLWMENNRLRIKGSTDWRYRNLLEAHIIPDIGGRRISAITSTEVNTYLADKLRCGRLDSKGGLSAAYVRSMMLIINSVLAYAAEQNMCLPLQTKIYKPKTAKRELLILTPEEQSKLVAQCCSHLDPTAVGVLLSLYAGLRIGEICALEWSDIDLSVQLIRVRKTVARVRVPGSMASKLVIEAPKTASSFREIPLCSWMMPLLEEVHADHLSEFVVSATHQFVSPRTYDYRYHRLLDRAGIHHVNYHVLRHTFATRCIEVGTDVKSLSEMLGHANAAVTLNTYVHPSMEVKRAQLEKLSL